MAETPTDFYTYFAQNSTVGITSRSGAVYLRPILGRVISETLKEVTPETFHEGMCTMVRVVRPP